MLRIRSDQMEIFRGERIAQFKKTALMRLRQRQDSGHSDRLYSDTELEEIVGEGTAIAPTYGFLSASHTTRFIESIWRHGSGFYRTHSWAKKILRRDELKPDEKLSMLIEGATDDR